MEHNKNITKTRSPGHEFLIGAKQDVSDWNHQQSAWSSEQNWENPTVPSLKRLVKQVQTAQRGPTSTTASSTPTQTQLSLSSTIIKYWMEEILHQFVDGLSQDNPIIYSFL